MPVRFAVAAAVLGLLAGPALADPIIAKDDTGKTYQLNDDGTYYVVARSADGRTFLLGADGTWGTADEDLGYGKKLTDMMDKAFAEHAPSNLSADDIPKGLPARVLQHDEAGCQAPPGFGCEPPIRL